MSTTPASRVRLDREDDWEGDTLASLAHRFLDQESITSQERCEKCKKYLHGVVHEGYLCYDCGLQSHRSCTYNLPCFTSGLDSNTLRQRIFGLGLCSQFDPTERPAPLLVMKLCNELESRARSLPNADVHEFYEPCDRETFLCLKQKIIEDFSSVELSDYEPNCITYVLKRFLLELPDPVIPVKCYETFVDAVHTGNELQCASRLLKLVQDLPEHHRLTLQFLLAHSVRLCQLHNACDEKDLPFTFIHVFCYVFIRPSWEQFNQVIHNLQAHIRILQILLFHGDWGEKLPGFMSAPALPPRKVSRPGPPFPLADLDLERDSSSVPLLRDAEWYWGEITRDEVNEKLMDTSDGTFLVRDASSKSGEYTLTLRKGGTNKLIKICHKNGKYGFSEPFKFNSVVELVNFYRHVSLAQYNSTLDIKLLYPVSRFQLEDEGTSTLDVEKIAKKLAEIDAQYQEKSKQYIKYKEDFDRTSKEIQVKKGPTMDAFEELTNMFKEQQEQQEKFKKEAQPHEIKSLMINCELLKRRIQSLEENREMLKENLKQQVAYYKTLDREMNALKQDIISLSKQKDQHIRWLRIRGVRQTQIDHFLAPESLTPWGSRELETDENLELLPHQKENSWFLPECSRKQASELLSGKPDGTFLVRPRTNQLLPDCSRVQQSELVSGKPDGSFLVCPSSAGPYALSIVCNGVVNHCIIYKTERGYGFAEPYMFYNNIKSLVLHHARNSLEEHNEELKTCLLYPVFAAYSSSVQLTSIHPGYV